MTLNRQSVGGVGIKLNGRYLEVVYHSGLTSTFLLFNHLHNIPKAYFLAFEEFNLCLFVLLNSPLSGFIIEEMLLCLWSFLSTIPKSLFCYFIPFFFPPLALWHFTALIRTFL